METLWFFSVDNSVKIPATSKAAKVNLSQYIARHHSYVLQKWSEMIAVDGAFDKAREVLYEILGINVWSKQQRQHKSTTPCFNILPLKCIFIIIKSRSI